MKDINLLRRLVAAISMVFVLTIFLGLGIIYLFYFYEPSNDEIQLVTDNSDTVVHDFVLDEGVEIVINNCTGCHSSKLVTQNRASREGWKATIQWMQKTQNLWELGDNEEIILDYLSKHYAPEEKGRRANLDSIEWYVLEQ